MKKKCSQKRILQINKKSNKYKYPDHKVGNKTWIR